MVELRGAGLARRLPLVDLRVTFLRSVTGKSQATDRPSDKELIMHVIASDLIASDIAAEFDWSSAEANQYLDSLLADDDNDWPGDADE
jgi:hypothetical protein